MYSKIKYAIPIYGVTKQDNISKIQVLQNKLLKILTFKNYRYSTNQLHNEFGILKVNDIINQEILTFVHEYINNKLPSDLINILLIDLALMNILAVGGKSDLSRLDFIQMLELMQ